MLVELRVKDLGVVEEVALVLRGGMTAITGETGAGKTMLTEAIRLLIGGRAEPQMVRSGAKEAIVEGRFIDGDEELVVSRVLPADGRSRAYVDGRMVPASALIELGERLVDLHGQHAHQALLSGTAQRAGLDRFGNVETAALVAARAAVRNLDEQLASLGGDARARAREVDLLRFQLEELEAAGLTDAGEDLRLRDEEDVLAGAVEHRLAAESAHELLAEDGGVVERLGEATKRLASRSAVSDLHERLVTLTSEVEDLVFELSSRAETLSDDPERLAAVQERRALLKTLQRKYGATLEEVLEYRDETAQRLSDFERHDERVAELEAEKDAALRCLAAVEAKVEEQRRATAPILARLIEEHLHELALPKARFEIDVDGVAGDDVSFKLGANPGMPLLPVAKAASGGELARTMLAMRLALLTSGGATSLNPLEAPVERQPETLIFDEVDAGIGGEAAIAVGRALSRLGRRNGSGGQVFVVTHLPQVAAFADSQVMVEKNQGVDATAADVRELSDADRETELARMLSGRPESPSGRAHARELLEAARADAIVDLQSKRTTKGKKPRSVPA